MRNATHLALSALFLAGAVGLAPALPDPGEDDSEGAEGPSDERVREAWSFLRPEEQLDVIARFEADIVWLSSFQNTLIEHALESLEEDPGLLPEAQDLPWFDPETHAPGQPIRRRRVDADASRGRRVVDRLAGAWPRRLRPAWGYDWGTGRVVRTADAADPERLFSNALAGLPPRLDLAEALVLAMLDDGAVRETHGAFAHAYTDRSGNAYPLSLYDAWCSAESIEMPDVDTLGVVHTLDDEWSRWVAPVHPANLDDLYGRIGEHFQIARRHRGLRVALARTFLAGSPDLRDGYSSHRDGLHSVWNEMASTPADLAEHLPDPDDWADYVERMAKRVDDEDEAAWAIYRRDLLDWESAQVRYLLISTMRSEGAFERKRRPASPVRKPAEASARTEADGAERTGAGR